MRPEFDRGGVESYTGGGDIQRTGGGEIDMVRSCSVRLIVVQRRNKVKEGKRQRVTNAKVARSDAGTRRGEEPKSCKRTRF